MSAWDRQPTATATSSQSSAVDQGLRSYMLKVYNYMASGVLLTAVIAYFAGTSDAFLGMMLAQTETGVGISGLGYVVMFAPLAMVFFMMFKLHSMSTQTLQITFWAYAAVMGLSLFTIFLIYTQTSILRVLFVTAGTFGLLSMYGYATKKDLTSWGTFLMVGMWAMLIVSLVNFFLLKSSGLQLAMSYVGVLLALGFTAYDTQKIKEIYYQVGHNAEAIQRASIMGALNLYMDFIYLFVNLMRILGDRR